jgi:hypothetical protein
MIFDQTLSFRIRPVDQSIWIQYYRQNKNSRVVISVFFLSQITFSADIDHHFPLEGDHPIVLMIKRIYWSMDGGI